MQLYNFTQYSRRVDAGDAAREAGDVGRVQIGARLRRSGAQGRFQMLCAFVCVSISFYCPFHAFTSLNPLSKLQVSAADADYSVVPFDEAKLSAPQRAKLAEVSLGVYLFG
jgi:hypothetical protein